MSAFARIGRLSAALLVTAAFGSPCAAAFADGNDPGPGTPSPPKGGHTALQAADDGITVLGDSTIAGARNPVHEPASPAAAHLDQQWWSAEVCGANPVGAGFTWPCDETVDHTAQCGDAPVVLPLWEHHRTDATQPWSPWALVHGALCGADPAAQITPEMVLTAFQHLPLTPSTLHLQPDRGWVLVHKDTIAYTDAATQNLTTTILGVPVAIAATPTAWTWDYGETAPFTTAVPGAPYPHQTVTYAYRHVGVGQVAVTTTWSATYTVGTDPTVRTVPGTATTTTTGPTFQITQVETKLVRGTCAQYPDDWGCP